MPRPKKLGPNGRRPTRKRRPNNDLKRRPTKVLSILARRMRPQEFKKKVEAHQGVDEGVIITLEGYFDNLAAAGFNKKSVLEQLPENNTKLAATNEDLVAIVKKWTNDIKKIDRETSRLNKTGGRGKRDLALCPHCKKYGYHAADA